MADLSVFVAFVAGLVSFLNPCVLPLVPGFLGYLSGTVPGDAGAGRWKIFWHSVFFVLGFSFVFALAGVLLGSVLQGASYILRIWLGRISGVLIILFGCQLLGILKIGFLEAERKVAVQKVRLSPYVASFLFGAAFGLSWTPCVGLILGSVLALAITHPAASFILLMSYALGLGVPFLVVGFFSAAAVKTIQKIGRFLTVVNKVAGVFLIVLGVFILSAYIKIAPLPTSRVPPEIARAMGSTSIMELSVSEGLINAELPFALKSFVGKKVLLLDFWRFECPNCQEMVPYIEAWYQKYKDRGLMVVSVHSPEFEAEKNADNVRAAVRRMGITYPVVLDNEHQNLKMYNIIYWPTLVLMDRNGRIVKRHIGAGGYREIEAQIVGLLEKKDHGR